MDMETIKSTKKFFSGIGLRMFFSTLVLMISQIIVAGVAIVINPQIANDSNLTMAVTMIPMYAIGFPLAFLIMKKPQRTEIEKHDMSAKQLLAAALMAYAITMVGNIIGTGITTVIGLLKGSPVTNILAAMLDGGNIFLIFFLTAICAPIFEELLFRKMLCDRLVRFGEGTAIVISGLLFGLFHGNFNQFIYALPLGMIFAFVYVKTGQIKNAILLHMFVNFLGGVVPTALLSNVDIEQPTGMIAACAYYVFALALTIAGIVIFCNNRKKFEVNAGEIVIEKGKRFSTFIANFGMLLFVIVWGIVTIAVTLTL